MLFIGPHHHDGAGVGSACCCRNGCGRGQGREISHPIRRDCPEDEEVVLEDLLGRDLAVGESSVIPLHPLSIQ